MPRFSYRAKTQSGEIVTSSIEAASAERVRSLLEARGLLLLSVSPPDADFPKDRALQLGEAESADIIWQVSQLSAQEAPLVAGLRAAAAESTRPATTRALQPTGETNWKAESH